MARSSKVTKYSGVSESPRTTVTASGLGPGSPTGPADSPQGQDCTPFPLPVPAKAFLSHDLSPPTPPRPVCPSQVSH